MRTVTVGLPRTPTVLLLTASATLLAPAFSLSAGQLGAQDFPTIKETTAHMESEEGFIPIHYDPVDGRLYLEVSLPGEEFLYHSVIAAGDGFVLARGHPNWMANESIVHFERRGPELVLLERNVGPGSADLVDATRADLPAEAREPFLVFLGGTFPIVAEEGGRVLVDGTDHFLQDVHSGDAPWPPVDGVPGKIESWFGEEGFSLDLEQSSIFRPSTRATPESTEVEALLTFVTDQPGEWARSFLPDSATFVVRERHSLSRLPELGFLTRPTDPRLGFAYSPVRVERWRLEKLNPAAAVSEVVEPIVVYLDAAMPERFRESARLGIGYWNQVLEDVGFKNALIIRDLPADADPLDPKFPFVVFWTPTQVVSSGHLVVDVRTGEIVRGTVLEAGRRERLEENFYRAIEPVLESGHPDFRALQRSEEAWTIAHEAGHVLASLHHQNINPSVMGMLRPRLRIGPSGGIEMDLSSLYPAEPFPYDEWMMGYVYAPFEPGEEEEGLLRIVEDGLREGMQWGDNTRERNPRARGYIHSDDPLTVLEEDMAVRRLLLERFGPDMLHPDEPESLLFERFVPVYFHHRYSLRAVATMVGGVELTYEPASGYQRQERAIDSRTQRRALDAILNALSPEELLIPSRIAAMIPPKLESSPISDLEWPVRDPGIIRYGINPPIILPLQTEGPFDPLGWARVLCDGVVTSITNPRTLTRVAAQHSSGQSDLSVEEILVRIIQGTWGAAWPEDPQLASLRTTVREAVLDRLLRGAEARGLSPELQGLHRAQLRNLLDDLRQRETEDPAERAHLDAAIQRIAATGLGEAH